MVGAVAFELRIVRITWASKDVPLEVDAAQDAVPLGACATGEVRAQIYAYPKVSPARQGQLAVRGPNLDCPPALVLADGSHRGLTAVQGADGRTWWIEKGMWRKTVEGGYHDAPLCRHAGEAHLRVGSVDVWVHIAAPGFTEQEFETLLDEFRNGLWQLVLDAASPATTTVCRPDGGISEAFLQAVRDHLRYANQALDQPHRELRERQIQQPLAKVRPTTRTFQELALRGTPKHITGRGHAPSFDTPENRQLLAMVSRLYRSLNALRQAAQEVANDLARRAAAADARAAELKRCEGWTKVDPDRLRQEIAELEARLCTFGTARAYLISTQKPGANHYTIKFKVTDPVNCEYGQLGFWADFLSFEGKDRAESQRIRVVFDHEAETLSGVFVKGEIYELCSELTRIREGVSNDRKWYIRRVSQLSHISSSLERKLPKETQRLKESLASLESNGYWRRLTPAEESEQVRDQKGALAEAQRFRAAKSIWTEKSVTLEPLALQAGRLIARAASLGIAKSRGSAFPGSMTYVQNPAYRGALVAYRRAMEAANLNTSTLGRLFRLDEVGVLDLPKVYERWCLLKLVRVLREEFRFVPEDGWRDLILKAVTEGRGSARGLSIRFSAPQLDRDVLLEYEPTLPSGKTPDFVLTLEKRPQRLQSSDTRPLGSPSDLGPFDSSGADSSDPGTWDYFDQQQFDAGDFGFYDIGQLSPNPLDFYDSDHIAPEIGPLGRRKLVFDAKCKQFNPIGSRNAAFSLADELQELIANRGYDEGRQNRVFVLHPGPDTASANDWRRFCRYGGGHFTADPESRPQWDQGPPDHLHGALLLRPGVIDPLIRAINMHLYLALDNASADPVARFCPACRATQLSDNVESGRRKAVQWCINESCRHLIVPNQCWSCRTHLWKLGGYWTFHETRALNPYDIKCPHCGEYLIREDPGEYPEMP